MLLSFSMQSYYFGAQFHKLQWRCWILSTYLGSVKPSNELFSHSMTCGEQGLWGKVGTYLTAQMNKQGSEVHAAKRNTRL